MKKVLYTSTVVKTHIMQFYIAVFRLLKKNGCEVSVAARNDYEASYECSIPSIDHYYDVPFSRWPIRFSNIRAYRMLKEIIAGEEYDIIHCHTPVAGVLTRLAAKSVKKKRPRIIYTAHGFHFYKGAPFYYWLLYYPEEKLCAHLTDVLITINKEDYDFALRHLNPGKVEFVNGVGVDIRRFSECMADRSHVRKEMGIPEEAYVVVTVGELIRRKNYRIIIKIMPHLPEEIHYVIVGSGQKEKELKKMAADSGVSDRIHFLGYRNDIPEIYKSSDLFVLPSRQEGLPVSLMEAMASGLPCVASRIRGCRDLIDETKGVLCDPEKPEEWEAAILRMYRDKKVAGQLAERSRKSISEYDIHKIEERMKEIYEL